MEDVMEDFTVNRSLCEVEFEDKNLKSIDVDVMEYVWVKIRDYWLRNQKCDSFPLYITVEIGFGELKEYVGRHTKTTIINSVERLSELTIVTNQKSDDPSDSYHFTFSISENKKYFKVNFNKELLKLFNKPPKYCEYDQQYIFDFNDKHTKLLFKFLIGYKNMLKIKKRWKMYLHSDVLLKILNVHTKKSMSKIQYDIFLGSFNKIRDRTGLDVELQDVTTQFENGEEIKKYTVVFNKYICPKEIFIENFLKYCREQLNNHPVDGDRTIPVFFLKNEDIKFQGSYEELYINDKFQIIGYQSHTEHTNSLSKTYETLNDWWDNDDYSIHFQELENLNDKLDKHRLFSEDELRVRRLE